MQIFISYRRDDSAGHAGRLEEALERHFGPASVFRDVEDLTPGRPFADALAQRLASAEVALVLIGPHWLEARQDGAKRLWLDDDYVRKEIVLALGRGIPVVPVLIDETPMPLADALPDALRPLAARHAVRVSDAGWGDDVKRLIAALDALLPGARVASAPRRRRVLIGAAALGLAVLAGLVLWPSGPPFPAGTWRADVRYPWGDRYDEAFVFERHGDTVSGSAGFLGTPRAIVDGRWRDGLLSFVTHSVSTLGSEDRTLTHRYHITRDGEVLRVRYVQEGGFSSDPPLSFEARRLAAD